MPVMCISCTYMDILHGYGKISNLEIAKFFFMEDVIDIFICNYLLIENFIIYSNNIFFE